MNVNKKTLASFFDVDVRTVQNWQAQGMPVISGGGRGKEVIFDSAAAIKWHAERCCEMENAKLRKEVDELRKAGEGDIMPGTIDYERYRLTRAQADAQELKNLKDEKLVVDTGFCAFALSRLANDISAILDSIPLSMQRRFVDMDEAQLNYLKVSIAKAMNAAAMAGEKIPGALDEYLERTAS